MFGGIASDLSALIMEQCFEYLDAPVKRVSLDTPIPFKSIGRSIFAKRSF
jgi:2-oxoisovalerate dehydrogenase E1 component